MDNKFLHNLKDTPYNERETFNNAILLLSMVKSEYYYIVGFSRPNNQIKIGFDLEDKLYGQISETFVINFSGDDNYIEVTTKLTNVFFEGKHIIPFKSKETFFINNGYIVYSRFFEKDEIIPLSMEKLNLIILKAKDDIVAFLEDAYKYILRR